MPEKSTDRRAQKTRKALANALAELLTQKELHKITVQEICDKAELNRGTLYRHYLDVYDLYEKIEKETIVAFALLLLDAGEQPTVDFFKKIIECRRTADGGFLQKDNRVYLAEQEHFQNGFQPEYHRSAPHGALRDNQRRFPAKADGKREF